MLDEVCDLIEMIIKIERLIEKYNGAEGVERFRQSIEKGLSDLKNKKEN